MTPLENEPENKPHEPPVEPMPSEPRPAREKETEMMDREVTLEETTEPKGRRPIISWGAIFAGLVLTVSITWLMLLLGTAIGVSVGDINDVNVISEGFGIAAIIWMLLTGIVAYFLGGLAAGRLSGQPEPTDGVLHGLTLWGAATVVTIWLTAWGVSGLIQTGTTVAKTTVSATTSAISGIGQVTAQGMQAVGSGVQAAGDVLLTDEMLDQIKQQAAEAVVAAQPEGGPEVRPEEIRKAIDNIDRATVRQVASNLLAGQPEQAKDALAQNTNLSDAQVDEIVQGLRSAIQEAIPGDRIEQMLRTAANRIAETASRLGGEEVQTEKVRQALEQLEPQTLQTVAARLIQGDTEGAKEALATETELTQAEIDSIVEGIRQEVSATVTQAKEQVGEVAETAADYGQAVLWTAFLSGAISLIVAILGGWLGARTVKRLYVSAETTHVQRV